MWISLWVLHYPLFLTIVSIFAQNVRSNLSENFKNYTEFEISNHKNYLYSSKLDEMNEQINQFRNLMHDELQRDYEGTDEFLIRWLQECNMDIDCASKMLRAALKWRQENNIDSILNKTILNFKFPNCTLIGVAKDGGPVFLQKFDGLDLRKLIANGLYHQLLSHNVQCMEKAFQASISRTKDGTVIISPGVVIVDVAAGNLKQHACFGCLRFYREVASYEEQYYPRTMRWGIIINVPRIGMEVSKLMISLLKAETRRTVRIFGADKTEWMDFLRNIISETELPVQYGGTKILASSSE